MARIQEDFSTLIVIATNLDSVPTCDSSLKHNCETRPSIKIENVPIVFSTEQVNAMIAAWDRCHLTAARRTIDDGTSKCSSTIPFEPSRQTRASTVPSPSPAPAKFQRKRISVELLKQL